jgi:ribosomal protein S18 acetylase RimI-like enzyme
VSSPTVSRTHVLDHPVWSSLTGPHESFALSAATARRYRPEVSPFAAIADEDSSDSWDELGTLVEPGEMVAVFGPRSLAPAPPKGWRLKLEITGIQMVATPALVDRPDPEAAVLGAEDNADMLALVARTKPGPFTRDTRLLGTYLGIRRQGALVAMAGERMHPEGWTEISAICTDPAVRGQGLASRLTAAVAHGIRQRGETPFLHVAASNENAVRLYETIGFVRRRELTFSGLTRAVRGSGHAGEPVS